MKKIIFRGLLIIVFLVQILSVNVQIVQSEETKDLPDWTTVANMNYARSNFTLSLLPNNTVLAVGGENSAGFLNTSEYYDLTKNTWTNSDNLNVARANHTATTLLDGRVLIVGGENENGLGESQILKSAEIYDPLKKTWTLVNPMVTSRVGHTATRLEDGRVLVVGGCSSLLNCNSSAEIYNPNLNTWTTVTSMGFARKNHAAVMLLDGTVMVTGGFNYGSLLSTYYKSTEIYDPILNTWTAKDSMLGARSEHFAVVRRDGKVVVAGGVNDPLIGDLNTLDSTEIYNPVTNTWISSQTLYSPRYDATALLDPFDHFILIGGRDFGTWIEGSNWVEARDIDIDSEDWVSHSLISERYNHASIQLATGALFTAGGEKGIDKNLNHIYLSTTVIYQNLDGISHTYPNTLEDGVLYSSGTLLPNGDILITGGTNTNIAGGTNYCTNRAYLWSAALDERDDLASMAYTRCAHSTTLLPDGRVVVIGGTSSSPTGTERNVVETLTNGVWQQTSTPYWIGGHTATLLPDGNILIIGVDTQPYGLLYDPDSGIMRQTSGQYTGTYNGNTATLLTNGKVLLAGSLSKPEIVELYDPITELFTALINPPELYTQHAATLLSDGRVLFTGGFSIVDGELNDSLIYDPTGFPTWSSYANIPTPRRGHSAVSMPNGKVVVLGGKDKLAVTNRVDIFDPALNSWTQAGSMSTDRVFHKAMLTTQGNIIIFGGFTDALDPLVSVERFTFDNSPWLELRIAENMWQPTLNDVAVTNTSGYFQFVLSGDQLTGDVEASSGQSNQAATNHPLVLAMRIGNGQMKWLNIDDVATDTSFESKSTNQLLNGPFLVFEFASGSRSEGKIALPTTGFLLSDLTLNPEIVVGENPVTGTVTLAAPAPQGGTTIALSSNNPAADVNTPLIIAEGNTSEDFTITTDPVSSNTIVEITAQENTKVITQQLVIVPVSQTIPVLSDLTLSSYTSSGGNTITGTVTININAPAGGTTISLSSNKPTIASVPPSVKIPEGKTSAVFSITIDDVDKNYLVTITAELNGIEKEKQITVSSVKNIFLPLVVK